MKTFLMVLLVFFTTVAGVHAEEKITKIVGTVLGHYLASPELYKSMKDDYKISERCQLGMTALDRLAHMCAHDAMIVFVFKDEKTGKEYNVWSTESEFVLDPERVTSLGKEGIEFTFDENDQIHSIYNTWVRDTIVKHDKVIKEAPEWDYQQIRKSIQKRVDDSDKINKPKGVK